MTIEIVELVSDEDLEAAFDVMSELRTHLDRSRYLELLDEMRPGGYRLFATRDRGRITALAGIEVGTNFYFGRYVWVYDLITTADERSKGHGARLLARLEELAREWGCDTIALASAFHRTDAHRFYEERAGFEKVSYTFTKALRG